MMWCVNIGKWLLPVAILLLIALPGFAAKDADAGKEFAASGYDTVRVENEYKLAVPDELTEAVWEYLQKRYDSKDLYLRQYSPGFTTAFADEHFVDRYFDTNDLRMLHAESGIRHRTRIVTSDVDNPKNGRELIQIKLKREGDLDVNRSEIKFPVKHYMSAKDVYDGHPLIGIIERDHRHDFSERVETIGIYPPELKNTLTLNQRRRRAYISLDGKPFATITLDQVRSAKWWQNVAFTELEMELNEIAYTEGSEAERAKMQALNDDIKSDLLKTFPQIRQDQTPKYNKAFNRMNEKFVMFPLALKYNAPIEASAGLLALLLLGGSCLLLSEHRPRKH